MKIAITADCHLNNNHPERTQTLLNLLQTLNNININHLIIAGDLFDKEEQNHSIFDKLARSFPNTNFFIIPGNHDPNLKDASFSSKNIKVISPQTPQKIIKLNNLNFIFIPYSPEYPTMDEAIQKNIDNIPTNSILISHGDYLTFSYEPNPYEAGYYMPLTSKCVEKYKFLKVFLGHIHKPLNYGKIFYPGSPHPIDITETAQRSFIIFDTSTLEITRSIIKTPYIYYDECLITYPVDNELEILIEKLNKLITSWKTKKPQKIILRLKIKGFTKDKNKLQKTLLDYLTSNNITLYKNYIDLDELNIINNNSYLYEKLNIFNETVKNLENEIKELHEFKNRLVNVNDIQEEILKFIFQEK